MVPRASQPDADPLSIWETVSPPRPPSAVLKGQIETDVVVVGGGFTGLSAALHLAQAGHAVCLIEGRTIGWGGSGRNNGQVIPVLSGSEPAAWQARFGEAGERFAGLVRDSAGYLFELAAREKIACEAEQTGWFQPAHSPDHVRLSAARCKSWQQRGADCKLLDRDETCVLLGSDQWYGGMLHPAGGHINPLMLARGLAAACERAGVQIYENSVVTGITPKAGKWQVSAHDGGVLGRAVVLATNAYSNELAAGLAVRVARSVVPVTSWQMSTTPLPPALQSEIVPGRQAVSDTRSDLQFFRYDARNQLISGAALMLAHNAGPRLAKLVGGRLKRAFPQLGEVSFNHIWSGYVGVMPDHLPHFHQLGANYWAAIGYNGRGVALSVSAGRELARAINGTKENELALPLSPVRPVPAHAIARRVSRAGLAYYRWRDRQAPKIQETTMTEKPQPSLDMLKGAFAMRADAYGHIYDVLSAEFGTQKAVELIATATRRLGAEMGEKFAHLGPGDITGLKDAFLGGIPCADEMFAPEVKKCANDGLEIQFHRCPLKDHWVAKGRSGKELENLCKAAGAIDDGLFTRAGFRFRGKTWKTGQDGCCLLIVKPGKE